MATNNFKAFALGPNANVMSQADWEALPALLSGFTTGKASSAQINKAIRQASFIAAALAQFVSDKNGADVLDDGDLPGFVTDFINAVAIQSLTRSNPFGDIKSDGTVDTAISNLSLGDIAKAGVCSGVLGVNGYISIPLIIGGVKRNLLIQWGSAEFGGTGSPTSGVWNNFTYAFPSTSYKVVAIHYGYAPGTAGILSVYGNNKTGFYGCAGLATTTNTAAGSYIAIGI